MRIEICPAVRQANLVTVVDHNFRVHRFRGNLETEETRLTLMVTENPPVIHQRRVFLFVRPRSVRFGEEPLP